MDALDNSAQSYSHFLVKPYEKPPSTGQSVFFFWRFRAIFRKKPLKRLTSSQQGNPTFGRFSGNQT
ncbi:hypothetical protein DC20_10720 [Rufibacter tibetensis]|uniref:Uncharacterized protein n=1 Tax=Rufibacter tibetensis TaxID=512763 RepID=A0A0P0C2X5_9BACT|nr:hypothetical protein DC20_10720 [Rufibacter tibetensis]